jgi:hypothetical protein
LSFKFETHLKACGFVPQRMPARTLQCNGMSERHNALCSIV